MAIDLDGTLIQTDLLAETLGTLISKDALGVARAARWLAFSGKAGLKAKLAARVGLDAARLPYNVPLANWLRVQQQAGRRLVLATASHRLLAEQVADHFGIFDEVLATEGEVNLKAAHKRDRLVERFGYQGFEYVGNDTADLPVWEAAARCHVVSSSPSLVARVQAMGRLGQVFDDGRSKSGMALLRALRPHQWVKNLLVLVPLFAAHAYGSAASVAQALLAFVAFCLCASSVYVLNDLVDLADDRHHPRKRLRPFASGEVSLLAGWVAWPLLLVAAFALSILLLPLPFTLALGLYAAITLLYSLRLKRVPLVDVLTLAGLYTLRIIAGATAIGVAVSFWLLSFSMFIFLSLAFVKRFSELRLVGLERADGTTSGDGTLRGRGYRSEDLETSAQLGIASGYLSVLVLALYIHDAQTIQLYRHPMIIWLACPLLLYWVSRVWLIARRGQMHDDPVVFAIRDRASWAVGAAFLAVFLAARFAG